MKLNTGTLIALFISTIAVLLILYARINIIFSYHPDTGGLEYELIYEIQRLLSNVPLYSDSSAPPFLITQKTPLYHLIVYFLATCIGMTADNVYQLFVLSGVFTFTMVLSVCYLCYKIARQNFELLISPSILFSACALCIMSHSHHYHSRMDVVYLFLFLLVYFLLNKCNWKLSSYSMFLSVLFSVLLFYTKQNGLVIIPLFSLTFLYYQQDLKLILCYFISSIFVILLLPFFSTADVNLFYQNIFLGISNGISFTVIKEFFSSEFQLLFIFHAFISLYFLYKKKNEIPHVSILIGFTLFSFLLGTIMSFKYGAGLNYFTEFKLLSCLVIIITVFNHQISFPFFDKIKTPFLVTFLLLTSLMGVKQYYTSALRFSYQSNANDFLQNKEIKNFVTTQSSDKSTDYVYIFVPGFATNFFHREVLLPTKSVFTPSFESDKENSAQLMKLQKYLKENIATYLILPDSKNVLTVDLYGYTFEQYALLKNINNQAIYQYISIKK